MFQFHLFAQVVAHRIPNTKPFICMRDCQVKTKFVKINTRTTFGKSLLNKVPGVPQVSIQVAECLSAWVPKCPSARAPLECPWITLGVPLLIPFHSSRASKWCYSIAVTFGFGTLSYFVVTCVFESTFEDTTCNLFQPKLVAVVIMCIVVITEQIWWFINPFKFKLK